MLRITRKYTLFASGMALLLLSIAACNTGKSDATRIIDNNAGGTISALSTKLQAAQTMAANANAVSTRYANLQVSFAAVYASNQDLTGKLNGLQQANAAPTNPPGAAAAQVPVAAGAAPTGASAVNTTPNAVSGSGMTLDPPVTAKTIDGNGCAIKPLTTFSTTDAKIWVVAVAHNMKKGVLFTANWSGSFSHQDTWTTNYTAAQICVHFYVEPKTIAMTPGSWTVSLSAPDVPLASATFTISGTAATAAVTK